MSPSLRFLSLVILGWGGFRAASLGVLPVAEIFRIERSEAKPTLPPIVPTQFPPIEPPPPAAAIGDPYGLLPAYLPGPGAGQPTGARPALIRYLVEAAGPGRPESLALPAPRPTFYSALPRLDDWPISRLAATVSPPLHNTALVRPGQSLPAGSVAPPIDRLQLTSWAMLRGRQGLQSGPSSIAPGGTLGASQAGARLIWNVTRQIAATMRLSNTIGRRGGEVAAGLRVRPLGGLPLWLNLERRQRIGRLSDGRNAFALFAEGGVYDRPIGWGFNVDAYVQAGVVGFRHRDRFVDGAITATRPIYRNLHGGIGLWGAAQPGAYRLDAGPRVTYRVGRNIRAHFDYRQRLVGNAAPGSGPVVTLAADF